MGESDYQGGYRTAHGRQLVAEEVPACRLQSIPYLVTLCKFHLFILYSVAVNCWLCQLDFLICGHLCDRTFVTQQRHIGDSLSTKVGPPYTFIIFVNLCDFLPTLRPQNFNLLVYWLSPINVQVTWLQQYLSRPAPEGVSLVGCVSTSTSRRKL